MDIIVYFKALSDATRIRLLNILLHHELSVNEIVYLMEMGQSRISRHLRILTDAGLLGCRRDGVWAFYYAADNGPAKKFIDSIRYLLNQDPLLKPDLQMALQIIEERKLKTMYFFNSIAEEWDHLKKEVLGELDLSTVILEKVDSCSVAVDLGCGTGELLQHLKKKAKHVIGVDSSARMLDKTDKLFKNEDGNIDLRLGELEHLPLKNNEADCAIISMVLHHLSDPGAAISEVYRILRSDGVLIITDFDKHENENMRKNYSDRWLGFTQEEMERLLCNNGFVHYQMQSFELQHSLKLNLYKSIKKDNI